MSFYFRIELKDFLWTVWTWVNRFIKYHLLQMGAMLFTIVMGNLNHFPEPVLSNSSENDSETLYVITWTPTPHHVTYDLKRPNKAICRHMLQLTRSTWL